MLSTSGIRTFISHVCKRPRMYVCSGEFSSIASFINGICMGHTVIMHKSHFDGIHNEFSDYLAAKYQQIPALSWEHLLKSFNPDLNNDELLVKLDQEFQSFCLTQKSSATHYLNLEELIALIEEPNQNLCLAVWEDNKQIFEKAKGSSTKHQAWEGGYLDHITEIMNIAVTTYFALDQCRKLPFSRSDALLTLFLHDLEKPWVYGGPDVKFASSDERHAFVDQLLTQYGFVLTDEHRNALKYVHGEGDDWDPHIIKQGPLGAFIHHCDNTSARIWNKEPKVRGQW